MNADTFMVQCRRTRNKDGERNGAANAGLGLAGEAGEVVELVKKDLFHGKEMQSDRLREELGDLLFYVAWVADAYGVSLEQAMAENVTKLQRRYPDGFVKAPDFLENS